MLPKMFEKLYFVSGLQSVMEVIPSKSIAISLVPIEWPSAEAWSLLFAYTLAQVEKLVALVSSSTTFLSYYLYYHLKA